MGQKVEIKQTKFSNGEISPNNYGDVRHPKWEASARTMKNWLPIPAGGFTRRPGLQFVARTRGNGVSRLLPFVFSDSQSFVVEISGSGFLRVYHNGAVVGAPYELAHPWNLGALKYLKRAQVGDVATIAYGGQFDAFSIAVAPQDLTHATNALSPWAIGPTPLKIPSNITTLPPLVAIGAWSAVVTYKLGDMVSQNNVLWIAIQGNNLNNTPPAPALNAAQTGLQGNLFWMPATDPAHPAISVIWASTLVAQDPNGVVYESGPGGFTPGTGPLSSDRKVPLTLPGLSGALSAGWTGLLIRLYRGSVGGILGLVNEYPFSAGAIAVEDTGISPDFTRQPPKGEDPFLINGADSYPSVVGYLDQRRLWAASKLLPATLDLSRAGNFYNYDGTAKPLIPGADTDAMQVTVASEVLEQVRSFVPMRRGLLFTGQGEWAMAGQGGGPVARANNDLKRQSKWGSSWLDPITIGTGVLFNTAKSNMVRDFFPLYGLYSDIWDGQDLTVLARHFFDNATIAAWAFQTVPYPLVWAARSDNLFLSLTYQHAPPSFGQQLAEGICGWAQHNTGDVGLGSAVIEDVCVVPEPPYDAVYMIVNRGGTRNIERMASPVVPGSPSAPSVMDARYGCFLDSCAQFDGHASAAGIITIDSAPVPGKPTDPTLGWYAPGQEVDVLFATDAPFQASDEGTANFVLDPENALGYGFSAKIVHFASTKHVTCELLSAVPAAALLKFAVNASSFPVTTPYGVARSVYVLDGAAHALPPLVVALATPDLRPYPVDSGDPAGLRGLMALGDGDMDPVVSFSAVDGKMVLQTPALVACVGIAYNSDMEPLDAYHPNVEIRNKFKNIPRLGFEVANSRGLFAGPDFAHLTEWAQRKVSDAYGRIALQSGYFETGLKGDSNKNGRVAIRCFQPLPCTITSILREMELGGS